MAAVSRTGADPLQAADPWARWRSARSREPPFQEGSREVPPEPTNIPAEPIEAVMIKAACEAGAPRQVVAALGAALWRLAHEGRLPSEDVPTRTAGRVESELGSRLGLS